MQKYLDREYPLALCKISKQANIEKKGFIKNMYGTSSVYFSQNSLMSDHFLADEDHKIIILFHLTD